jgi:hypothetical protein
MSALEQFFYPLPARRRTAGAVLLWWEQRRLAYNLIVGSVGCATVVLVTLIESLPGNFGRPSLIVLLGGSAIYGLLANLCYSLGAMTELALYRLGGEEAPRAGPVLFRQGLIFSVGLTLFPVVLAGLGWVVRLFAWVVG